jgi:hypothetical protein
MLDVCETGEMHTRPFVGGLRGRDYLEDLAVDGRTV